MIVKNKNPIDSVYKRNKKVSWKLKDQNSLKFLFRRLVKVHMVMFQFVHTEIQVSNALAKLLQEKKLKTGSGFKLKSRSFRHW